MYLPVISRPNKEVRFIGRRACILSRDEVGRWCWLYGEYYGVSHTESGSALLSLAIVRINIGPLVLL